MGRGLRNRSGPVVAVASAGLALGLYVFTAAPGLTWANFGADGGDLLAAAVVNGVPHPTGYPLYTLLLQGWLEILGFLAPASDIAWRGNLFSALAAAGSVGITADLAYRLLDERYIRRWLWALFVALAWAGSPLLWGQALITEVYALHALLFTALGRVVLVGTQAPPERQGLALGLLFGLGLAHHLTVLLLLPALLYWLLSDARWRAQRQPWLLLAVGVLPGLLLYLRIPLAAAAEPLAPVNWGLPERVGHLWWLVSGAAYRRYLFAVPLPYLLGRVSRWSFVISSQFTPIGFGVALAGLYYFDQNWPRLRNFGLLWVLPLSIYAVTYNTADSEIYLLPVVWIMALWLPDGLHSLGDWLAARIAIRSDVPRLLLGAGIVAGLALIGIRGPGLSLRHDTEATDFLADVVAVVEPNSLIFSSADAETFTLWYGAWTTGELLEAAPHTALVNVALYQFEWYRDLVRGLYPQLAGTHTTNVNDILAANRGRRPIFFTEIVAPASPDELEPAGAIWKLAEP